MGISFRNYSAAVQEPRLLVQDTILTIHTHTHSHTYHNKGRELLKCDTWHACDHFSEVLRFSATTEQKQSGRVTEPANIINLRKLPFLNFSLKLKQICNSFRFMLQLCYRLLLGPRWRSWLRHCTTNRKVAGLIPDGVIRIFYWHNPSDRIMALGSTQPPGG
jgi:hypothetical protein